MSRIAVTVKEPELEAEVEPRFGRAPFLLLVDPETLEWEVLENPGREAGGGAGVRAARLLAERGVGSVVSGEFGPNADNALREAGIEVHHCREGQTAREAVESRF